MLHNYSLTLTLWF